MDQRQAAISSHNQIRALSKDIPAYSIAVEVVRDQAEILENLEVKIQRAPTTGGSEVVDRERIEYFETPCNSHELDVEQPVRNSRIKGHFGDYIGMEVWRRDSRSSV